MKTYATWLRLFELQRYYSWIVDRFHISTCVYQLQACSRDYDPGCWEQRLPQLKSAWDSSTALPIVSRPRLR